jgi:proliferating cell nuclear antigen
MVMTQNINNEIISQTEDMSNTSFSSSNNVLEIETVQIAPFRTLMTALKDILQETNITFTKQGMRIINMDKSHTILAHLFLRAENFEKYLCNREKIVIGVNLFHLFKLINTIDNDDTLTIYIEKDDYSDGVVRHLGLRFDNGDIRQVRNWKLRLIEPEIEDLVQPEVWYDSILNLPSSDFQKIIRDLSCISEKLEIKSVGKELIFSCSGQFAEAEVRRTELDGSMEFVHQEHQSTIIQGVFSLKNLNYFIKCTNLCPHIEMYLGNGLPLVVKYNVASLGDIKLCLVGLPKEKSDDEDDSD